MSQELRTRHQSREQWVRALSSAWRASNQLYEPSVWLQRDPDAEEKMLRDADIAHAVNYRRHLIAGRQWTIQPQEGAARPEMSVHVATQLLRHLKHFTSARFNLARAFLSGARFAQIHGTHKRLPIGDGQMRWWWVPTRLEDLDRRTFRIVPERHEQGKVLRAHWEKWDVAQTKWCTQSEVDALYTIRHVYQDDQASLGYGRGLREAIGWCWYAKEHVFQESLQAAERFAQGILTAKIDGARDANSGMPNDEVIERWTEVLTDLRSKHVLVHDASDTIEHLQVSGEGWQLLKELREEMRTAIHTLVLGANLTTGATEGGSYALAEIQENSTEALIQFDRETLEETLSDDLLGCLWYANWANLVELGVAADKPRFNIKQEKRIDPVQRAQVAQQLNQMGVPLSLDDIYEQTGFRKPEDGEPIVAPAPPPPPAVPGLGGFGLPGLP